MSAVGGEDGADRRDLRDLSLPICDALSSLASSSSYAVPYLLGEPESSDAVCDAALEPAM